MSRIVLKPGHVQPVWAGHPWIFPQGVAKTSASPESGDEVEVYDAEGHALGRGFFSKKSAIAVRLFAQDPDASFDRKLLLTRLSRAHALRRSISLVAESPTNLSEETTGYRAFHGEGDGIPGLIVDRYGTALVVQLGIAGLARHRDMIFDVLEEFFAPQAIIERTNSELAQREGFEAGAGIMRGASVTALGLSERGLNFEIPLSLGQKTGFYFDQRPLRKRVEQLASGRRVLDTYSYVGATGLFARRGGAKEVLCVDSSAGAVETGRQIAEENRLEVKFQKAKALDFLTGEVGAWDLVLADPPKLAQSRAGRPRAMKALRKIAALATRATAKEGLVVISSCSAAIGAAEVERCLALGAKDVGRRASVLERVYQGGDHPVHPAFTEGRYLSSVIAFVD